MYRSAVRGELQAVNSASIQAGWCKSVLDHSFAAGFEGAILLCTPVMHNRLFVTSQI